MLFLNKEAIETSFNMVDAIEASKAALVMYCEDQASVPLRTNINVTEYEGQSLYMPAYTNGQVEALGVKIVSVYPKNIEKGLPSVPSTMVVLNPETGIVSAVLDGTHLTQLRTAAVQGAATDLMANKDAEIAALIGTGGQGFQQAIAMMTVRELKELRVFDINFERSKEFTAQLQEYSKGKFATKIMAVETSKEAVTGADIVTTVTTSKVPTFDAADIKAGAHVNGVGAYTPEMMELPSELLVKANSIIFDTNDGVLAEAGDIITPLKEGKIYKEDLKGQLGEVALGKVTARHNESDITVFKTVGTAVLDVVTAHLIVEKCQENGQGVEVNF